MEIEFHGQLEEKVIQQAVKLMSKALLWMLALRIVFAILILIALGSLIFSYFSADPLSESRVLRVVIQVLVLGYFVVQPYITSHQLFKRLSAGRT
ncbi:MAG TPA: hypothetical protein VLA72_11355 [Anaerolineales bacterium]|nr:hypothetical protein [Anaerolineales bacterium]